MGHLLSFFVPEAAHLVKTPASRLQRTSSQRSAKSAERRVGMDSGSGAGMGRSYRAVVELLRKVSPELEVRQRRMRKAQVPALVEGLGSQLGNELQGP
jgi:hypothetical protein